MSGHAHWQAWEDADFIRRRRRRRVWLVRAAWLVLLVFPTLAVVLAVRGR